MRSVSTGVGLCVLGVCVLGAAALSSPRLGNSATAAGSRSGERLVLPTGGMTPLAQTQSRDLPAGTTNLTDCDVRVEHWFSPNPHFTQACNRFAYTTLLSITTPCDFLGTGKPIAISSASGGNLVSGDSFLEVIEFSTRADGTTDQTFVQILSLSDSDLFANLNSARVDIASIRMRGLHDMDGDGDLDLVLDSNQFGFRLWLENIAGDAVRRSPYDHDGDGHVTTADLSLLLMEFTD